MLQNEASDFVDVRVKIGFVDLLRIALIDLTLVVLNSLKI